MIENDQLRRDMGLLEDLLGQIVIEDEGAEALQLVTEIRHLARQRRTNVPGAEATLSKRIRGLNEDQVRLVSRSLSIFFDLANLAEDRQRVRVLRQREQDQHPDPISESIGASIQQLKAAGLHATQVQQALDQLDVELVFTAHPSEAKRRSIRSKLRRMRQCLEDLDRADLLPRERAGVRARLRADLTVLWQTEFLRPMRPSVLEEVERGLSIMPRLWEVVPEIYLSLRLALVREFPDHEFALPRFLRFGSWMGGDRDGHPGVTWDITERTLVWLRDTAINRHLDWCRKLYNFLSVSRNEITLLNDLPNAIAQAEARWPEFAETLSRVASHEIYRRWIRLIEWRLKQSRCKEMNQSALSGAYRDGQELEHDVDALLVSLHACHGQQALAVEAQRWLDLTRVFGLNLTRLDVRQDASRYREVMTELLRATGDCEDFSALDEADRQAMLVATMGHLKPLKEETLAPLTQETLSLFRMLRQAVERFGPDCLGGHIVSMTRWPSDLLTVLWLWRRACAEPSPDSTAAAPRNALRIIPLFEKIGDLRAAPEVMANILDRPVYVDHLKAQDNRQIVMVGYSDSTKDGGYLAACWGLDRAQDSLHQTAAARNVRLTFFHGRGGSLGRGGGPAARGILSLPPDALGGSLRLTEQGEVLAEVKYSNRADWQTILEMYRQWPFFQATIDNAATALAKTDMYVGQCYSELCSIEEQRREIWMLIASERDRSRQAILDIVGGSELLATTPWFQGSIEVRNPDIDPLNLIQIELLRRRRALDSTVDQTEQQRLRDLLRLSVQGVAAGMRTTG